MRGQEFMDWLSNSQQCTITPIEGRNITGFSVKILCRRTGRVYYFSGPFGNNQVPSRVIKEVCDELWIEYPPEIKALESGK